jgi:DNA-binding protein HU-beta
MGGPTYLKRGEPVPMTKSQILTELAEKSGLKKKEVANLLLLNNELIMKLLKKEKKAKLDGLGIFRVKQSKARMGRNPATGEPIKIKAKTRVRFTVAKALKDQVL